MSLEMSDSWRDEDLAGPERVDVLTFATKLLRATVIF
jgi:hypothetical protein